MTRLLLPARLRWGGFRGDRRSWRVRHSEHWFGELIHSAEPVVCRPSVGDLPAVCYSFLKALNGSEDRRMAAGVAFCGERCREWSKGSFEVEKGIDFSAYHDYCRSHGLKYPLLVMRLACLVLAGETRAECHDILQPAYLSMEMIAQMEEEFALLKRAFKVAGLTDERIAYIVHVTFSFLFHPSPSLSFQLFANLENL
ncbi:hypothetical protein MLD38_021409 [Melastoma candidum]|uniref:Uncharacterized protein n=1 Tax=Melastoma candidum TaxID=119954 RepID=A0ACB9QG30_9MYRT|nr:hypothetical protein MLD38_021409 [Melastoma candidum]